MADFCGAWHRTDPKTRGDVLGDFAHGFDEIETRIPARHFIRLGICEGHGSGVVAARDDAGGLWLIHVPLDGGRRRKLPDPIAIPPRVPVSGSE